MKNRIVSLLLLVCVSASMAQISFRNQLVYTNWEAYNRTVNEDWADINYQHRWFKAGLRYEVNMPPDPFIFPKDSLVDEFALTFRYARFRYKRMSLTVGNYYEMFGRGLLLRTYEDRNLRVDNNLDGIKFGYKGRRFKVKALAGKMRDKYNRRKDTLYGMDAEMKVRSGLYVGGSYLYQDEPGQNHSGIWASRVKYSKHFWDVYGELAKPDWYDAYSMYAALNLSFETVALTMEYKDYNHLSFANHYGTEYNAAPSLNREHSFSLLNRHPHALNQNDETGYQVEATFTPWESWEFLLNHSQTFTHAKMRMFNEWYAHVHYEYAQAFEVYGAVGWNFDFATNTENITPLLDGAFNLSERDQLHLSYQHQHTKSKANLSEYDNEFLLMEYSRAPWFSAALVGEWTNKNQLINIQMDRNYWLYGMLSFNFWQNQRLSVLYGSRREGFVCVGGVCRYEPEFKGLEIKLTNRF